MGPLSTTNKGFHHEKIINDGLKTKQTSLILLEHKCEYCQLNFVPDGDTYTRNEDICQKYRKRKKIEFYSFGRQHSICNNNEIKEVMNWKYNKEEWREERERVNDAIIL